MEDEMRISNSTAVAAGGAGLLLVAAVVPPLLPLTLLATVGAFIVRDSKKRNYRNSRREADKMHGRIPLIADSYPSSFSLPAIYSPPTAESVLAETSPQHAHDILREAIRARVFTAAMPVLNEAATELARDPRAQGVEFYYRPPGWFNNELVIGVRKV